MGYDFLRHIERTRILVHVIDVSGMEGRDPLEDFHIINKELKEYSEELSQRPQIIAANKSDIPDSQEHIKRLRDELEPLGYKVFPVSAAQNKGFEPLLNEIVDLLNELPETPSFEEEEVDVYSLEEIEPFMVTKENGEYVLSGPAVDKLLGRVNLDDYESLQYFQRTLRKWGMIDALKEKGVQDGDTVRMGDWSFDFLD